MTTPYSFTLTGADGATHSYVGTPILAAAGGVELALQIYALAGGPAGALITRLLAAVGGIGGLMGMMREGGASAARLLDMDVESMIGDVDLTQVGESLAMSLARLPPKSLQQLLSHTSRDGAPLKQEANFNAAFTGNYLELAIAIAKVAHLNGFFTSGRTSESRPDAPILSETGA